MFRVLSALFLCALFPSSLAQTNYDGVKLVIVNYMTAFEGNQFNSSAVCFDQVTTSKMDADLVAMSKSLLFGKTEDFLIYYKTFVTDLENALWVCQVGDVKAAFDYNVQKHGFSFILGNVFWRALDIYSCAMKAFGDMLSLHYGDAATNLGLANRYVSPPKPANATSRLQLDPTISVNFSLGLAYGLEVYQQASGPCFMSLGNVFPIVGNIETDIAEMIHGHGNPGELTIHIAQLITAVTASAPLCDYLSFLPSLERLTIQQVLSNLESHWSFLLADIEDLKNCKENAFKCGENIGEIIRFTISWGLYSSGQSPSGYDFLMGLLSGLEASPNSASTCVTDVASLSGLFNQTLVDLQDVLNGDYSAAFALISDLKSLLSSLQKDSSDCNLPALGKVISTLLTPQGVSQLVQNFNENLSEITKASKGLSNCLSNSYECGLSAGEIARLVLGWAI